MDSVHNTIKHAFFTKLSLIISKLSESCIINEWCSRGNFKRVGNDCTRGITSTGIEDGLNFPSWSMMFEMVEVQERGEFKRSLRCLQCLV